jgi:hypothetical protein
MISSCHAQRAGDVHAKANFNTIIEIGGWKNF